MTMSTTSRSGTVRHRSLSFKTRRPSSLQSRRGRTRGLWRSSSSFTLGRPADIRSVVGCGGHFARTAAAGAKFRQDARRAPQQNRTRPVWRLGRRINVVVVADQGIPRSLVAKLLLVLVTAKGSSVSGGYHLLLAFVFLVLASIPTGVLRRHRSNANGCSFGPGRRCGRRVVRTVVRVVLVVPTSMMMLASTIGAVGRSSTTRPRRMRMVGVPRHGCQCHCISMIRREGTRCRTATPRIHHRRTSR